jgi:hypothetical protein
MRDVDWNDAVDFAYWIFFRHTAIIAVEINLNYYQYRS